MEIDWSTARVTPARAREGFVLSVELRGTRDEAFIEAWNRGVRQLAASPGDERRDIHQGSALPDKLEIEVSPIDPDDVAGERRRLEDLVRRVNRGADGPRRKAQDEAQRRREDDAARAERANVLTEEFQRE